MSSGLDFGVLGPLQLSVHGTPVALGTPKQRAVLAMLVMNRNRPISSDALVGAAWEQFPPPERNDTFQAKKLWQRFLIVLAGPLTNFLFAILVYVALFASYGEPRTPPGHSGIA